VNKKQLDKLTNDLIIMRDDFFNFISSAVNRKIISEKTKISESNLCNYAAGTKIISDSKIIKIYKSIL